MCEFGEDTEIVVTRRVRVDRCLAPIVSRLNAAGVSTTSSCCGHGKHVPRVMIEPTSGHRARSLGLDVNYDTMPRGSCPEILLVGRNLAMIEAMPLQGPVTGGAST